MNEGVGVMTVVLVVDKVTSTMDMTLHCKTICCPSAHFGSFLTLCQTCCAKDKFKELFPFVVGFFYCHYTQVLFKLICIICMCVSVCVSVCVSITSVNYFHHFRFIFLERFCSL